MITKCHNNYNSNKNWNKDDNNNNKGDDRQGIRKRRLQQLQLRERLIIDLLLPSEIIMAKTFASSLSKSTKLKLKI